jgi:hypothetical protein
MDFNKSGAWARYILWMTVGVLAWDFAIGFGEHSDIMHVMSILFLLLASMLIGEGEKI